MSKHIKDTDYLVISARIKAMETALLTRERMEQLLEAKTDEEVARILQECGYAGLSADRPEEMDAALTAARESVLQDLGDGVPDRRYLELFKIKYDYHNAKAILKAAAMHADPASMLQELGRVESAALRTAVDSGEDADLPPLLADAVREAKEVLDTTRDPQLSDMVLDRWRYRDELASAQETGSAFLTGYVRISIDAANLRALVRTLRMGKTAEFLTGALVSGGTVAIEQITAVAAAGGAGLAELYAPTELKDAGESGAHALQGGALTEFEKRCDDAVGDYLSDAQRIPFGEAPLVGYLAARETEYTNLRILLMGRRAGLAPEIIRSRLRASYV